MPKATKRLCLAIALVASGVAMRRWSANQRPIQTVGSLDVGRACAPLPSNPRLAIEADTDSMLQSLRTSVDNTGREIICRKLDARLNEENAPLILRGLPKDLLESPLASTAIQLWSEKDPFAVLVWLADQDNVSERMACSAVRKMVREEPEKTRRYIEDLPDTAWKQLILNSASISALLCQMPEDAASWLTQLTPDNRHLDVMEWAALEWAKKDPVAAAQWASGQSDSDVQDKLLAKVALGYASRKPDEAMKLALQLLPPGEALNQTVINITASWADVNPAEAARNLDRFSLGEARPAALTAAVALWSDYDPENARHWILERPAGPERDDLVRRLSVIESQNR